MRDSGFELVARSAAGGADRAAIQEIDYGKTGLTRTEVAEIVQRAGSVAAVLNTRHATAKANGWVARPPSPEAFARAVEQDVNLLRRPILIDGKTVVVGFDRVAYGKLAPGRRSGR